MITYKEDKTGSIKVYLEKKYVGKIVNESSGWTYYPKGSKNHGEYFPSIKLCKNSLERE